MALALVVELCMLLLAKSGATLPPDFDDALVARVPAPTALAFMPDPGDDRLLVASRPGKLRVYESGTLVRTPVLDLTSRICDNKERGLLGLAVDPKFNAQEPGDDYVYVYYTYKKYGVCPENSPANSKNPVNRVSRFVMKGNTINPSSEKILFNNIPSPNGNHNGGDLHFGKDGNLYISVGDGGCNLRRPSLCQYNNAAARYRNLPLGKILRIKPKGGIPRDNPFVGEDSGRCNVEGHTARGKTCQEIFALGFRNPFRFAVDPNAAGTTLRVNDVGGQRWEEIDELDAVADAGADYGWNLCEGRHDNSERPGEVNCDGTRFTGPIYEYSHSDTNCESITGGTFVPNNGSWPSGYDDSYLFADFVCNKIFKLGPGGSGSTLFADVDPGGPIAMTFGPNGSGQDLYYTTFAGGGQVRRIAPVTN